MSYPYTRLLVRHFPECFRFYRDILQLQPSWGDEADRYASFTLERGGPIVLALFGRQSMAEVMGREDWPAEPKGQDRSLLIFEVPDVDETVERFFQMGVKITREPANFSDLGIRSAYIRDPDGNLIELCSGLAEDRWSPGLREAAKKWGRRDE